ncbi:MAG: glucans biosynthesis glucosyltransferase MdoH [Ponticaulis sp.]|nr:glucans biosynthesis glucosyltransferase MdoH [Ponticaulis sp.]
MAEACPPEAPLEMPEQPFSRKRAFPEGVQKSFYWRKVFLVFGALAITVWLGWLMFRVLNVMGLTHLEWGLLALFIINIAWISFAFVSACAGFWVSLMRERRPASIAPEALTGRTAILFPVYNESVRDVFATVEATAHALAKIAPGRFECFILSDTVSAPTALEEESGFLNLFSGAVSDCPVYYRRRTINVARKSGNIHDFVSRWGGRYEHFLIFDADSYMSAETLVEMAARMESDPRLGLLQTVPKLIGGTSLFARVQQFAAAVYGPVLGRGIAWWSQNEGNYWGHNAIIRTKAFAEAAGLPVLPGRAPFGGHIMSHDFVEAALLRRAGWKVRIAADLNGSYEEGPQTIIDLTIRDRRWCQGNLQHSAVLARARGITGTNRLHFMIGIFSYLASPLWMVLILVGMALSLQNRFLKPEYFSTDPSLTPRWPVIDPALALSVFGFTMAVLLLPKLFGAIVGVVKAKRWTSRLLILPGVLLETLVSALIAPILMVAQTASVVSIVTGRDSGWTPQKRGSDGYRFVDVARRHAVTTVFGIVLTYAAWRISPVFAAWLAPATLGMVLAIPLSWSLGRDMSLSDPLARMLSTREARHPPACFTEALSARAHYDGLAPANLRYLIESDEAAFRSHIGLVDRKWPLDDSEVHIPLATASAKLDRLDDLDAFLGALGPKEEMAVLNSVETVERARARYQPASQTALA